MHTAVNLAVLRYKIGFKRHSLHGHVSMMLKHNQNNITKTKANIHSLKPTGVKLYDIEWDLRGILYTGMLA